jgi:hypothetical protein
MDWHSSIALLRFGGKWGYNPANRPFQPTNRTCWQTRPHQIRVDAVAARSGDEFSAGGFM